MIKACQYIADSTWFSGAIIAVIVLAGVVVGVQTYPEMNRAYGGILRVLDIGILVVFTLEVIIKMVAKAPRPLHYFNDSWNIFDFVLVAACLMEPILPIDAAYLPVLRLIRILRVLKLITAIPDLQLLVGALLKSIPSMFYVSVLLSLLFYIFAAMGVTLFGVNDPVHFRSLQIAMLTLFRVVTLEDWTDVMYINMYGSDQYGYAPEDIPADPNAMPIFAAFYFVSFVVLGTMIVLNLFIGIIMNSMDETRKDADVQKLLRQKSSNNTSIEDEIELLHNDLQKVQGQLDLILSRVSHQSAQVKAVEAPSAAALGTGKTDQTD